MFLVIFVLIFDFSFMKNRILFSLIFLFATIGISTAQILEPVKWKIATKATSKTTADITFTATIEKGWHVYALALPPDGPKPTVFVFEKMEGVKKVGDIQAKSGLVSKFDPVFEMDLAWYDNEAIFVQKISFKDASKVAIEGYIDYMTCNDQACMADQESFTINKISGVEVKSTASQSQTIEEEIIEEVVADSVVPAVSTDTNEVSNYWKPVISELRNYGDAEGDAGIPSLWIIFLAGFGGGLLALLTPCVWPIIPMTVSFFLKRNSDKKRGRRDATLYGLAIIIIYVTLGLLITLIFGASALNSLSTNAIFNLFFFALLVVFAISFFGAFEITLPSSWTTKLDSKAESTTGFLSIMLMAFVLVLVSFSCTGPIIGLLLVEVSVTGSVLAPAIGMFGFAVALAIPFSLFAIFPTWLNSLPKSGGWMNSVKVVLAFLELALALKFLSVADLAYGWGILDREVFVSLWIIIFALLGFYLLGKIRFPHDSPKPHTSVLGLFLGIISLAFSVYMIPGLWGAPLKAISAFAPPLNTQDFNLYKEEVHPAFTNYDLGMAYAKEQGKPVVIDFTGFGCVNCRKMETSVWLDPTVKNMLNNDFVLISLYVDDKTPLAQPYEVVENGKTRKIRTIGDKWSYLQRYKFGANAQPFYVMLDNEGMPMNKSYAFDEDPQKFINWLKRK